MRYARENPSRNRKGGEFERGRAYTGWKKGLFKQAWFESGPEREMANILDEADDIDVWVRLHTGDLPILWDGADRAYNPDQLAVGSDGRHWIVEVKSDKDLPTEAVQEKRKAALAWANIVTAHTAAKWSYLLVAERDLKDAHGSWTRLCAATEA